MYTQLKHISQSNIELKHMHLYTLFTTYTGDSTKDQPKNKRYATSLTTGSLQNY